MLDVQKRLYDDIALVLNALGRGLVRALPICIGRDHTAPRAPMCRPASSGSHLPRTPRDDRDSDPEPQDPGARPPARRKAGGRRDHLRPARDEDRHQVGGPDLPATSPASSSVRPITIDSVIPSSTVPSTVASAAPPSWTTAASFRSAPSLFSVDQPVAAEEDAAGQDPPGGGLNHSTAESPAQDDVQLLHGSYGRGLTFRTGILPAAAALSMSAFGLSGCGSNQAAMSTGASSTRTAPTRTAAGSTATAAQAASTSDAATTTARTPVSATTPTPETVISTQTQTEKVVHEATVTLVPATTSETESSSTDWGWVAFGILAAAVIGGGTVLWVRKRHAHPKET